MTEKLPLFLDSANSRLLLKNYPFRHESWYERGMRFNRWGGRWDGSVNSMKNRVNPSWYAHRSRSIKVYCLKSAEFIHNFQSWFTVIRLSLFIWVVSFAQCQYFDYPNTREATLGLY